MNDPSMVIEYDVDVLKTKSVEELLLQIIGREDLKRPNRQLDIEIATIKALHLVAAAEYLEKLKELNLPDLTDQLEQITEEYMRSGNE